MWGSREWGIGMFRMAPGHLVSAPLPTSPRWGEETWEVEMGMLQMTSGHLAPAPPPNLPR